MPRTSPKVTFGLYAMEIKQDGAPSASVTLQPFSKIEDLRVDNVSTLPFATYEPDFWLLDGGYKFIPTDHTRVHVGLISLVPSDDVGDFTVAPVLTIVFSQVHDTDGLTLHFSPYTGDYASSILVSFYDASDVLIRSDSYSPPGTEFSTGQAAADFKKIEITFNSTNKPNRYLRVSGIDYGEMITFTGADIKSAQVIEEIDPISSEVKISAFELGLYSSEAAFSIINPAGDYAALTEHQPLAVYEIVDGAQFFIGRFYLDKWENQSNTQIYFQAMDLLGILDTMSCKGGIYSAVSAETLIEQLLGSIYIPYVLDPDLTAVTLTGWIPICTYRQALQQIAFAIGASVSCTRYGSIQINTSPMASGTPVGTITAAQKSSKQTLELKSRVTDVELIAHNYLAIATSKELFNGTLAVGTHEITFTQPMHTLNISGATITESGANYAILNVAAPGAVVLSGQTYQDNQKLFTVTTSGLDVNIRRMTLRIANATLVNSTNAASVAQRVYDYHQQRYKQKVKLFAPTVQPGDVIVVDSLFNQQIIGVVEKMDSNLAMGFTSEVEIVGTIYVG